MLELKHLKTVQALRQSGSMAGAAQLLHMTQSALSHQIKELEHRVGQSLFVRKSKPLQLTSAGQLILRLAEQVLPLLDQTERQIRQWSQGDGGRLHMAIECHSCFQWLLPALDSYREQWPNVEVDFASGFHFDALQALLDCELDLVITADPVEHAQLQYLPLFSYENKLIMAKEHPLTGQAKIQAQQLTDETLITYPVEAQRLAVFRELLTPAGVAPVQVRQAELTLMIVQLVLSGRGVASLPDWVIAEYEQKSTLQSRSFQPALWSTLYAAIRVQDREQEYLNAFVEMACSSSFARLKNIRPVSD